MEDIAQVIFEKYLENLEVAVEEQDVESLFVFWKDSLAMGSKGIPIRAVIDAVAEELLPKDLPPRLITWNQVTFQDVVNTYNILHFESLIITSKVRDVGALIRNRKTSKYCRHFLAYINSLQNGVHNYRTKNAQRFSMGILASYLYLFVEASRQLDSKDFAIIDHILENPALYQDAYTKKLHRKSDEELRKEISSRLKSLLATKPILYRYYLEVHG